MEDEYKEVRFDIYCPKCENADLDGKMDPCNQCLETGMRVGTEKPDLYSEKGGRR